MARPIPMIYIVFIGDCPDRVYTEYYVACKVAERYRDQLKSQGRQDILVSVKSVAQSLLEDA